jgi:RNA polymerase sigma-70 factor (ECF subfamily)
VSTPEAIERLFREEHGRVLATLIRHCGGDFALAEDALQDALAEALGAWPRTGVPERPAAWITTTARRRAIDRLRRAGALRDRLPELHALGAGGDEDAEEHDDMVADDRLRLIFTCCHPALALDARVALTLRTLGGLSTPEIARAFLTSEPAMQQRLVRAKRKISAAGIPYAVPRGADLPARTTGVLAVLYLVFNEGYAASAGVRVVRADLCAEALRLARLVRELLPDDAETAGLLALMLLLDGRRAARTAPDGRPLAPPDQDRGRFDHGRLDEGRAELERALRLGHPGPYQLQAAIAELHTQDPVDWPEVAALYGALARLDPSPVVTVNRAVAVGMAGDARRGLALLDATTGLADYQPLHAARAELLRRAGELEQADAAYARAIALSANDPQRAELERRRAVGGSVPNNLL